MTDYNDGKWHAWNGGECPVDPEAHVDIIWINRVGELKRANSVPALFGFLPNGDTKIITFRVVKPAMPYDPLAALTARVERLEATLKDIARERDRE